MNPLVRILLLFSVIGIGISGAEIRAQTEHSAIRRLVVFPVKTPKEVAAAGEEAWWQIRETLTDTKRFMVASKNFLMQKDVFQARGELSPPDAIILGKLLDAQAVLVTYLDQRYLRMKVYEGQYGRLLWEQEIQLQASLPLADQLLGASQKLTRDFIASFPYQGIVVLDPLKGKAVFKQEGVHFIKVDIGHNSSVEKGDSVQLLKLYSDSLKPLFGTGGTSEVFGEGRVVSNEGETLLVALDRVTKMDAVRDGTLVRMPKELARMREAFSMQERIRAELDPTVLSPEMTPLSEEVAEKRPLYLSLTFIANLAAFLLMAF